LFWHGYWIDEVYMDNGYISMIVKDGIVYMILIGIAIAVVSSRLAVYEKIFIFAYALYTLMEAYALNTSFVFPMLIVGRYLCNPGLDGREDDTENVQGRSSSLHQQRRFSRISDWRSAPGSKARSQLSSPSAKLFH
jgi:hypothetical protein